MPRASRPRSSCDSSSTSAPSPRHRPSSTLHAARTPAAGSDDGRMSRRQRRAIPVAPEPEPAATAPLEGRLVGYRLLRRIASGERADVYLAADAAAPSASPRAMTAARPRRRARRRRLGAARSGGATAPAPPRPRRAAGLRRRRAGGVDRPRARGDVGGCLGHAARAPRRGLARRRAVLPRRGATRRARALAHHRRAHPEPG